MNWELYLQKALQVSYFGLYYIVYLALIFFFLIEKEVVLYIYLKTAWDDTGETMIPISWTEMQCPLTGQIEQRKVAKVGN